MISYQVESAGKPLARAVRELPAPVGTEVIVRIGSCGVCHSDVHLHDGYFDLGEGRRLDASRMIEPPRTLGHEIAGTVAALGPDARGASVGDRRVVYPWIGCGQCATCRAGEEQLCARPAALGVNRDGGFADHVVVPHPRYLFDYDPLPEEQACVLACSGLTAYGALTKVPPLGADDALLLIGAGGVGLSGIRLARHRFPLATLVVAEVDRSKWELAREAGASELVDPNAEGAGRSLMKATGGGVAAAIDFVGAGSSFAFGLGALRKSGRLICVGLFGGSTPISPMLIAMKSVSVVGSYVGSPKDLGELIALARAGTLPPMPISTAPLDQVDRVLADLAAGRIRGRTILKP